MPRRPDPDALRRMRQGQAAGVQQPAGAQPEPLDDIEVELHPTDDAEPTDAPQTPTHSAPAALGPTPSQNPELRWLIRAGIAACVIVVLVGVSLLFRDYMLRREMRRMGEDVADATARVMPPPLPPDMEPSALPPPSPPAPSTREPRATVKINSWWTTSSFVSGPFSQGTADPGKIFMIVNVTVTNVSTEELSVFADNLDLTASDRNIYYSSIFTIGDQRVHTISGKLLPGGSCTGDVVYETSDAARPVDVQYTGTIFGE